MTVNSDVRLYHRHLTTRQRRQNLTSESESLNCIILHKIEKVQIISESFELSMVTNHKELFGMQYFIHSKAKMSNFKDRKVSNNRLILGIISETRLISDLPILISVGSNLGGMT